MFMFHVQNPLVPTQPVHTQTYQERGEQHDRNTGTTTDRSDHPSFCSVCTDFCVCPFTNIVGEGDTALVVGSALAGPLSSDCRWLLRVPTSPAALCRLASHPVSLPPPRPLPPWSLQQPSQPLLLSPNEYARVLVQVGAQGGAGGRDSRRLATCHARWHAVARDTNATSLCDTIIAYARTVFGPTGGVPCVLLPLIVTTSPTVELKLKVVVPRGIWGDVAWQWTQREAERRAAGRQHSATSWGNLDDEEDGRGDLPPFAYPMGCRWCLQALSRGRDKERGYCPLDMLDGVSPSRLCWLRCDEATRTIEPLPACSHVPSCRSLAASVSVERAAQRLKAFPHTNLRLFHTPAGQAAAAPPRQVDTSSISTASLVSSLRLLATSGVLDYLLDCQAGGSDPATETGGIHGKGGDLVMSSASLLAATSSDLSIFVTAEGDRVYLVDLDGRSASVDSARLGERDRKIWAGKQHSGPPVQVPPVQVPAGGLPAGWWRDIVCPSYRSAARMDERAQQQQQADTTTRQAVAVTSVLG